MMATTENHALTEANAHHRSYSPRAASATCIADSTSNSIDVCARLGGGEEAEVRV